MGTSSVKGKRGGESGTFSRKKEVPKCIRHIKDIYLNVLSTGHRPKKVNWITKTPRQCTTVPSRDGRKNTDYEVTYRYSGKHISE